jgi:hypothetical protein
MSEPYGYPRTSETEGICCSRTELS